MGAGRRGMNPITGQRVGLDEAPPCPTARGDDRAGSDQRLALPLVVERHVHQHDEAEALRVLAEYRWNHRSDQTVEQDQGAVRHRCEDPREAGARSGTRLGPGPGHCMLAHRPPRRGQAVAHLAVVGVAAARRRWIVDVVGQHDMYELHRDRS